MHCWNTNCHNSVYNQLILIILVSNIWFSIMLNPLPGLKNSLLNCRGHTPILGWNIVHNPYKWLSNSWYWPNFTNEQFAIVINLCISNYGVDSENLAEIHGFPEAIFKISAAEIGTRAKLGFTLTQLLFVIEYNFDLYIYAFENKKSN